MVFTLKPILRTASSGLSNPEITFCAADMASARADSALLSLNETIAALNWLTSVSSFLSSAIMLGSYVYLVWNVEWFNGSRLSMTSAKGAFDAIRFKSLGRSKTFVRGFSLLRSILRTAIGFPCLNLSC